jgi:hypothetical protein
VRHRARGLKRFTSLSQEEREEILLSWADSRVVQRRAAFQALRKGTLLAYDGQGAANGDGNPVWDAMSYPGPLGPPPNPPGPTIEPVNIESDTALDCDVVVVGSGAGGGTAAAVLSQAGLDVIVVEAGRYFTETDFDGAELSGFDRLYLNGGGMASVDGSMGLLAGQGLGGTTLINYTAGCGVLLRDHGVGEVRSGSDGEPIVRYRLTPEDVANMRRGIRGAARIVEAMGAWRIYSSQAKWVAYEPGTRGDLDSFMRDADGL